MTDISPAAVAQTTAPNLHATSGRPATNPFQATDIHRERLVWNPTVHQKLYSENCYYFLLRMRNPDIRLQGSLQQMLAKAQILSSCIYVLYGYYDVLIRIWATSQKRSRFVRLLEDGRATIDVVQEFQALAIDYLWAQPAAAGDPIPHRSRIEAVAKSIASSEQPDQKAVAELMDAGLLHSIPSRDTSCIKFYVALTKVPGTIENKHEGHRLHAALSDNALVSDVSIYAGIGFANYLIKGVAPTYPDIIKCTNGILDFVSALELRPMTLLIANNDAPEADQIDCEWEDFSTSLVQLELVLGTSFAPAIASLPQEDRTKVGHLFKKYSRFLGTPFEPIFRSILVSRLEGDYSAFVEKLMFIMRIEALLRRSLRDLFVEKLGQSWHRTIEEAAKHCGINAKVEKYTLLDYLSVTGKLVADGQISTETVDELLGPDWRSRLENLRELRNAVAHGEIFEEENARKKWWNRWDEVANMVCEAGDIYNALVARHSGLKE